MNIYMGTVALEPTRWGSRQASFPVSKWLPRFEADGFDGVELWEFHYLRADAEEQASLVAASSAIAIYNAYAGFSDADAEDRYAAADAIAKLQPLAVKYNFGGEAGKLKEYRRNLLSWAEALPASCRLLCECHQGTVLENVEDAASFFSDLDPDRFGVIAHVSGGGSCDSRWFTELNGRTQHVHVQMRGPESDASVLENRDQLDASFSPIKQHFSGSMTIEFSRGIGRDEDIEVIYQNACTDLAYCRETLAC